MSDPDYTIPVSQIEEENSQSNIEYGYKILNPGDVIGTRYQVLQELGSGGFATTYLAIDTHSIDRTKCVIKQLQPRYNTPSVWQSAKERLDTEGMVLQWLGKHNRIPQLLNHFDEGNQFYLVLEFIEGEELDKEVQRQVFNEDRVVEFLCDVLPILDFVHRQGVIHRDIKPSNLIRRSIDGKMALIDFGAVKELSTTIFDSPDSVGQTQVIGTPGYMAPEQNNGKPLYSSDIYALGQTVIYTLTGRSPNEWEEIENNSSINWFDKLEISDSLAKIIQQMICRKTSLRYSSVREVLQDIKPLLMVGKTVRERYYVTHYIGGEGRIDNYIVKDLQSTELPLFFLKKLRPKSKEIISLQLAQNNLEVECEKLAKLGQEDSIVRIRECFREGENLYLLSDYIPGERIDNLISKQKRLSEEEVTSLLLDTALALVTSHQQNIIHGNIKPSSLLRRSEDNKILLQDFGSINEIVNTFSKSILSYISPEQITGIKTFSSDIYALGMTAIYGLTGLSPESLEQDPKTGKVRWDLKVKVSPKLRDLLNKMICLDRRKRYQSAKQLVREVKKLRRNYRKYWYLSLFSIILLLGFSSFAFLIQWRQRAAILEFYQADIKLKEKRYQKAVDFYDEGLKKLFKTRRQVQHFEQAWLQKARALNKLKNYDRSLATCNEALQHYQSYQLWNCKGLALYGLERYSEAVDAYNKAIDLAPEHLWTLNNRGEAYIRLGEVSKAIADFEKAIEIADFEFEKTKTIEIDGKLDYSRSFIPWSNLGKLYYQQREYQKSIAAYKQSLKVKSDYVTALIGLGNAYKSSRQYSLANISYNRAIEINPQSSEAWYSKGTIEELLGNYRDAVNSYQKAVSLTENWEAAINALQRAEKKLN